MLGVQTGGAADGQFHNVSIKVNRPGVEVLARKGYYAPSKPSTKKAAAPPPAIDAALAGSFPAGSISISTAASAFAAREAHRTDVGVIVGVHMGAAETDAAQRFSVVVKAFDKDWNERASSAQTVDATASAGTTGLAEVYSRLKLPPGRYELRAAVESGGRTGSVFTDVEVLEYSSAPFSVSGLVVARTNPGRTNLLSDLATGGPTIARTFASRELIAACLRVYEGGRSP